jgi:hypothetical protein
LARPQLSKAAALLALAVVLAACGDDNPPAAGSAARPDSASGDVAQYSLMKNAIGWLTDSNVVALASQVNDDAQGIARLEAQGWTKEPLRFLVTQIIRDHSRLQYAIDSLTSLHHLPAQVPAVAPELKAPYDSMLATQVGLPLADREAQLIGMLLKVHERSLTDFGALAGNATDPDLKALLANRAVLMEQTHIAQTRLIGDAITKADSARQDSLKARRKGRE